MLLENDSFVVSFYLELRKEHRSLNECGRKHGGDWITGYLPRLCVALRVVLPLKGLKNRITLASQKCVSLDRCTRSMGRPCIRQR